MSNIKFTFNESRVANEVMQSRQKSLSAYVERLNTIVASGVYETAESSIVVPSDTVILEDVMTMIDRTCNSNLKYIFVVGIGGSNLGTKAVYDALVGLNDGYRKRVPNIIFIDTIGEKLFEILQDICNESIVHPDEVLINVISKSGGTAETIFNIEALNAMLIEKLGGGVRDRIVVTTNEGSDLWNAALNLHIHALAIPELVGGRYSVFTAVGLYPLGAAGFDIGSLLAGAQDMRLDCLKSTENPAVDSAIISVEQYTQGFSIHNTFIFKPELESIGRWYRQLMGESIGKRKNRDGEEIRSGMVPMVSVGSTDLHSMAQLYLGGPKIIFHHFIHAHTETQTVIPDTRLFPDLVSDINGVSNNKLMHAIMQGTQAAFVKQEIPFVDITFEHVSEYTLGEYLQFRMIEMMYIAELLHVNAFNQPSVEEYKIETKQILSTK